jgi:hypothetical protein
LVGRLIEEVVIVIIETDRFQVLDWDSSFGLGSSTCFPRPTLILRFSDGSRTGIMMSHWKRNDWRFCQEITQGRAEL